MSFIDWNASALPSAIQGQNIQNNQAAFNLERQRQAMNALQGLDTGDVNSVNQGVNALSRAMMFDQASALSNLSTTRAVNTGAVPLVNQDMADEQAQQQQQKQQQAQATAALHAEYQKMSDAASTLANMPDDSERIDMASQYARGWRAQGAPESEIQQVLGDLSPEGLKAHAQAFASAAQGDYGDMIGNFPDTAGALQGLGPGASEGATNVAKLLGHPWMTMALAKAGLDPGAVLNPSLIATQPQRQAPFEGVTVPTATGASQVISGQTFAKATQGGGGFTGPGTQQQAQMQATGTAAGGVGEAIAPDGSHVQGNWTKNQNGTWTLQGASIQAAGGAPVAAATPSIAGAAGLSGAAQANTAQATAFEQYAGGYPTRKANLENLRQAATQVSTGPNAPFWGGLGALAAEYGVKTPITPTQNQTAAYEEVAKVAQMVLSQQRETMGLPNTNQSVNLATGATPHESTSPQGLQRLAGILEGNEDYINAERQAWQSWKTQGKQGYETWQQFVPQWNAMFDPRVFQAQYMDPAQRALTEKAVGPKFGAMEAAAKRLGYIAGP